MTTLTHFGTAVDVTVAELKMEAFLPADQESAAILAELSRCGPATPDDRGPSDRLTGTSGTSRRSPGRGSTGSSTGAPVPGRGRTQGHLPPER
jgi:hypothetical protein